MKSIPIRLLLLIAIVVLSLEACSQNVARPTASPATNETRVPSVFPPTWTNTPTLLLATTTLTPQVSLASPTQSSTETPATLTPQATSQFSTQGDAASLVSDVTVPDGAVFSPGDTFTKTWRLSNTGTTTWTTDYSMVYVRGSLMGSVQAVPLPVEVASGKTVDLSVSFTAPSASGQYTSLWMLKNGSGQLFGVGPGADQPFFVLINVATPITGTVTQITTAPGSLTATDVNLSVDQTTYSGSCPVTLNLSGSITTTGNGVLTFQLEAGSSTPGFTFTLPGPQTETYTTGGSHTLPVSYFLDISSSVNGWVRLYISTPNTLRSTQVDFTITCK